MSLSSSFLIFTEATLFVGVVVAISLGIYCLTRWRLNRFSTEETKDVSGSVLFRIASLHSLVLALVFSQELESVGNVSTLAGEEASLLSNLYHDAGRYGSPEMEQVQQILAQYGVLVLDVEWELLGEDSELSPAAWDMWDKAYRVLLQAEPENDMQTRLQTIMISEIRELSKLREAREYAAIHTPPSLFFWASIIGIVLISAAYFTWAPTLLHLGIIGGFAAYTGLILYFVVAFSNPYTRPGGAAATGFERFLTEETRESASEFGAEQTR